MISGAAQRCISERRVAMAAAALVSPRKSSIMPAALTAAMGKADVKSYAMAILRGEQKAAAESKVRKLAI